MPAFVRNHSSSPRLMMPALVRNHSSRLEEIEKKNQFSVVRKRVYAYIVHNRGKKTSPSEPGQRGKNIYQKEILRKNVKKFKFFQKFLKIISLKVESLRAFLSIMIQNFQNAYIPHPKISRLKRGAKKLNFQPNMVLETCHIFSMKKILPSFNIGVVIALIHCLICLYRGKETRETEKNNVSIRHGSLILAFLRLCNMQIFQRKKMTCQKKQALMLSKGHKSATYTQNEKETTSMYSLKEFFKSCECRVKCLKTEVKGFHQEVDFSQVYNLKQFFKSCNYSLVPQYSQVETVLQCENGVKASDNEEECNIYDHLNTVPSPMPEPLSCKDYVYSPSCCNVRGLRFLEDAGRTPARAH